MKYYIQLILLLSLSLGCSQQTKSDVTDSGEQQNTSPAKLTTLTSAVKASDTIPVAIPVEFDRQAIKAKLETKVANGEPLVIHVMIPLCDNDNQGIVKVSKSLGDGQNLSSNLYWGALYGLKTHFKRHNKWTLNTNFEHPRENILERVVFERTYPGDIKVIMVGDAYRGDRMRACLFDYFHSLSGELQDTIELANGSRIAINTAADLLVFNGHNGLMDSYIEPFDNVDGQERDAVAIACISSNYFNEYLIRLKAYPLLMTTNLLAPEAYVLSHVVDAWVGRKSEDEILMSAARGYHEYQKCGIRGAKSLFKTGW